MSPSSTDIQKFKKEIWGYYKGYARDLPWRKTIDPYCIFVSEIMLQQTQVSRVIPKYEAFIKKFPTAKKVSEASIPEILTLWQGLGYNRRALQLKRACEEIVRNHKGRFPTDRETLISLPGIGQSTTGAIRAFAFNMPSVFIETNIRAVYLYHFFKDSSSVSDKSILELIESTVDQKNPREWYYALYDYGSMLKAKLGSQKTKVHMQSSHYNKQTKFEGSNRQVRSNILKSVLELEALKIRVTFETLKKSSSILKEKSDEDIDKNLKSLVHEGFLTEAKYKGVKIWKIALK